MSALPVIHGRGAPINEPRATPNLQLPGTGAGREAGIIYRRLANIAAPPPTSPTEIEQAGATLDEKLFASLGSFKIFTAQIAMHLDTEWREKLFRQLDSLLDAQEWDQRDLPPTLASFATFLRLMLLIKPEERPGFGASSDGKFIAAWTVGDDRLTLECLPGDLVRFSIVVTNDGERERVAGVVSITRLTEVIAPYGPDRWLRRA